MFLLNLSVTFFLVYGSSLYTLDVTSPLLVKRVADNCPCTACFLTVPFKEQTFLKFNVILITYNIVIIALLFYGWHFLNCVLEIFFYPKVRRYSFGRLSSGNLWGSDQISSPLPFSLLYGYTVDQDRFFKTLSFPSAVLPLPQIIYPCMWRFLIIHNRVSCLTLQYTKSSFRIVNP